MTEKSECARSIERSESMSHERRERIVDAKYVYVLIPIDSYLRSGLYVLCVRCACYKSVLVWGSLTFAIDCCPVLVNLKKQTEKPKMKTPKSDLCRSIGLTRVRCLRRRTEAERSRPGREQQFPPDLFRGPRPAIIVRVFFRSVRERKKEAG